MNNQYISPEKAALNMNQTLCSINEAKCKQRFQ
jgi:hypothetical protein